MVVISIIQRTNQLFHLSNAMKSIADAQSLDKLTLTAVISCCATTLYFLVVNLLA